jgi:hypothetical protein
MKKKKPIWRTVLLVCIFGLVLANLLMAIRLASKIDNVQPCPQKRGLPCEAIPIKFAMENPQCANKLLRAMNVTNVNFVPAGTSNSLRNKTSPRLKNLSVENK